MRRALLLLPLLLAACETPPPKLGGAGMDMFTPVKVRLHPLSRVAPPATPSTAPATAPATPAAPATIEARLEFTDQFNDAGKSPGDVHLQLFDAAPGLLGTQKGPLLGDWTFSLNTPDANRDHWDRTTRTYLFRLPITKELPHDRLVLTATVTLPNRSTLADDLTLPAK